MGGELVEKRTKETLPCSCFIGKDNSSFAVTYQILERDANTSLFHRQTGSRKRKNFIPKLLYEDQVVTDQEEKQDVMFDYFDGLLGTALPRSSTLDLSFFHRAGFDL